VGPAGASGSLEDVFGDLSGQTSDLLSSLLESGLPADTTGLLDALEGRFGKIADIRSADIKEQLGGLGHRFSTLVGDEIGEMQEGLGVEQSILAKELMLGSEEGARGRQMQSLLRALQIPAEYQQLASADYQNQILPLLLALQFGGGGGGQVGAASLPGVFGGGGFNVNYTPS
jgi:hypothetical protein